MTSRFSALVLGVLVITAADAGGPANDGYHEEQSGHFDYYWPGRHGGGRPGDALGDSARTGYPVDDAPSYSATQGWQQLPFDEPSDPGGRRWDAPDDTGPQWANPSPGDWRIRDGRLLEGEPPDGAQAPSRYRSPNYRSGLGYLPPSGSSTARDYRFRPDEAARSYSGQAPRFGAGDYDEPPSSAYPRYRFRGDPVPGQPGWQPPAGASAFRFRPLSDLELERIQSSSGYRPLGSTRGASFYRPQQQDDSWRRGDWNPGASSGPWVER